VTGGSLQKVSPTNGSAPPFAVNGAGSKRERSRLAGRIATALLLGVSAATGLFLWYVVNYGHYETAGISEATGLEEFGIREFTAIKGKASPLKFKACFSASASSEAISSHYSVYEYPVPLVAPGWFDCFDAAKIGKALESGEAQAYLVQDNVRDGIDRVAAVFPDGRAFAWHQVNNKFRR